MRLLLPVSLTAALLSVSCSGGSADGRVVMMSVDDFGLDVDSVSWFDRPLDSLPEPTVPMPFRRMGNCARIFNDSNYVHRAEAERIGLKPMSDTRSHWNLSSPLEKITSCEDFYVEPLTYSRPYLIPKAAAMLHEIGRRFNDSIRSRGGGAYRIKVTSALRTPESVARLKRRNRNAVDSSVHQLGTTIDISYARFACFDDSVPRSMADLKGVLSEVLQAMREEGKCWVKHEVHQPCFHITVRDY